MADLPATKSAPTSEPSKTLARIPLTKILIRSGEDIELPGYTNSARIDCGQQAPGRQFVLAWFVPAHQVIELEHYKHEKAEPYRTRIPISMTRRFD